LYSFQPIFNTNSTGEQTSMGSSSLKVVDEHKQFLEEQASTESSSMEGGRPADGLDEVAVHLNVEAGDMVDAPSESRVPDDGTQV
jgi:hypothetical protein